MNLTNIVGIDLKDACFYEVFEGEVGEARAFQDAGGDIVLSGHVHNYERFAPQTSSTTGVGVLDSTNGIREFVVGTGGTNGGNFYAPGVPIANSVFQLGSTNGVLKLTLHPTTYDWQFIRTSDGSVLDAGSGTCH